MQMFAEAIICHSYPLRIVEHDRLWKLHSYLNPNVKHVSRNTILRYCILEHQKLKKLLLDTIASVESRICFTCDLWSSCNNRGYLTLTAHYVDNRWTLRSKVLNFRYCPPPHSGVDIYEFVLNLIKEWNLQGKAFTMTVDNAESMDVMVYLLRENYMLLLPCLVMENFFILDVVLIF